MVGLEVNQQNTLWEKLNTWPLTWESSGCILLDRLIYSHYAGKAHIWQAVDRLPAEVQSPSQPWKQLLTVSFCSQLQCPVLPCPSIQSMHSVSKVEHWRTCNAVLTAWEEGGDHPLHEAIFSYQGTADLTWEAYGTPVDVSGYISYKTHHYLRAHALLRLCTI